MPLGGVPRRRGARLHERCQLHPELPRHCLQRQQMPASGPTTRFIGRNMMISKPNIRKFVSHTFYPVSDIYLLYPRAACKCHYLAAKVQQPHSSSVNQDLFPAGSFGVPRPFQKMFAHGDVRPWRIVISASHLPLNITSAGGRFMAHASRQTDFLAAVRTTITSAVCDRKLLNAMCVYRSAAFIMHVFKVQVC